MEVGTGEATFEALADGDALVYDLGPQGGWHVFGSLRAAGVVPGDAEDFSSPDNPIVSFLVHLDGAPLGGYEDLPRPLDPAGDRFELVGDTLVLDILDAEEIDGREATLDATLNDACGASLVGSRRVWLARGDAQ